MLRIEAAILSWCSKACRTLAGVVVAVPCHAHSRTVAATQSTVDTEGMELVSISEVDSMRLLIS